MKLGKKQMVLVSFMLFSLFFGAGNLIFPPILRAKCRRNYTSGNWSVFNYSSSFAGFGCYCCSQISGA